MAIKVPMFMDISRRFLPLLLTLCCALALPPMAQAGEKQAQVKPRVKYHQYKDTGWNVCRDMVKNLELLQMPDDSYYCGELKFHPDMPQFSEPEWEELKIEDWLEEIHAMESGIGPGLDPNFSRVELPFAEWKEQYLQSMEKGYFHLTRKNGSLLRYSHRPRLRMARVRFEQNGPLQTVLAYTTLRDQARLCKEERKCWLQNEKPYSQQTPEERKQRLQCLERLSEHEGGGAWGQGRTDAYYIYAYAPENGRMNVSMLCSGEPGRGIPDSCTRPVQLFLHNQRAYLTLRYDSSSPEFYVFRIKSEPDLPDGNPTPPSTQYICRISPMINEPIRRQ